MDIEAFRASLAAAGPSPTPCARFGSTRAAIGTVRMTRRRATRAERETGCTPICIARRATPATPLIGIAARASRFAELHSTKNGRRSPMRF